MPLNPVRSRERVIAVNRNKASGERIDTSVDAFSVLGVLGTIILGIVVELPSLVTPPRIDTW